VAESFSFTAEEIRQMQEHQRAGSLADFLKVQIMSREGSTLRNIAGHNPDNMAALIERIPAWSEANVAYQIYNYKDGHRVLAVYSARRMVDFLEKGQLNPNASGEDGLLHKHASLAFHIDPRTPEPWTIRLQDSSSEKSPEDRLQRFYRASL
jgi:hypothetical protein